MTSISDSKRRSIDIGYSIHQSIIEESRLESSYRNDGTQVFGYLDHDLIGKGKLPFVKFDQRTGKISRSFSKDIADRIKSHVEDLRVYFDYVLKCDYVPCVGSETNISKPLSRVKV